MKYPNIEAERARIGMSKSDFADALNVTRHTYYNWQSGKSLMTVSDILRIGKLTGKSVEYLTQEDGNDAES